MNVIVKQPEDIYSRCCGKHISARYIVEVVQDITVEDVTIHTQACWILNNQN